MFPPCIMTENSSKSETIENGASQETDWVLALFSDDSAVSEPESTSVSPSARN